MSDGFIQIAPDSSGKRVDNKVFTRDAQSIYRQRVETYDGEPVSSDASARSRVSQLTTLFDGKTLRQEDTILWDTKGTGTRTFVDGAINNMAVTSGQYLVRQSRQYLPYFSGKSQLVEITFDTFAAQANVTKRVGYFSSSATAPYTADYDGWYIESSDTIYLVIVNNGVEVLRRALSSWVGAADLASYNWNNFTVVLADFLWLGGAVFRLFVKDPAGGFILADQFDYAGTAQGVFMRSPNQPVRYEIRSSTGTGALRAICSQVATEGSVNAQSESLVCYHSTLINANNVSTIYAVKGLKKRADFRDVPVKITQFGGTMTATADSGVWMLLLNPTLSATLTYAQNSVIDEATATTQTVTAVGRVLGALHINQAGASVPWTDNQLAWLNIDAADTPDEYVLAYMALTSNQSVNGAISIEVF